MNLKGKCHFEGSLFMRVFSYLEQQADLIIWKMNRKILGVRMAVLKIEDMLSYCALGLENVMDLNPK